MGPHQKLPWRKRAWAAMKPSKAPSSFEVENFEAKMYAAAQKHEEPHRPPGLGKYFMVPRPPVRIFDVQALNRAVAANPQTKALTTVDERNFLAGLGEHYNKLKYHADQSDKLTATLSAGRFWDSGMGRGFMTVHGNQLGVADAREGLAKSLFGMKATSRSVKSPSYRFRGYNVPVIGKIPLIGRAISLTVQGIWNAVSYPKRRTRTYGDEIAENIRVHKEAVAQERQALDEMLKEKDVEGLLQRYDQDVANILGAKIKGIKKETQEEMVQTRT